MSKRNLILLLALVLSVGAAVYVYKDWLKPEPIQIAYTVRPAPVARNNNTAATQRNPPSGKPGFNVTFAFNQELTLTTVKVFSLPDALTNKYPYAIWDLERVTNSPPVKSMVYGTRPRGLNPTVKGARPEPLVAGAAYRLVIEAGDLKAEKDFQIPR